VELVTSRALSLLAAFSSPVFMAAAIGAWLYELWPANPVTLAISAFVVIGGPILGIVHVATASEDYEEEAETVVLPVPVQPPVVRVPIHASVTLTPKADAARRFANWRDQPNAAIALRERERRASQYVRT
jgi:dipeptide/tripeptide permease